MNNTLPLARLAEIFAERGNLKVDYATRFIRAFFDAIEARISADRDVTIKGFGRFLAEDGAIVFLPDPEFASRANAAYEAFPTIDINDDVDISEIIGSEKQPDPQELPQPEPEPIVVPDPEPTPVAEPEPEPEPTTETETVQQPLPEMFTVDEPVESPTNNEEAGAPAESDEEKVEVELEELAEVPAAVETPAEKMSIEEPVTDATEPIVTDESESQAEEEVSSAIEEAAEEEYELEEPKQRRCCTALWIIVALLVGLAGGIVLGYLGRHRIEAFFDKADATPADSTAVDMQTVDRDIAQQPVVDVDTSAVVITEADIAEINDPTTDPEATVATVEPKTDTKKAEPATPRYDTVTSKRFLTTMARQYYGHQDYWSYIYQANQSKLRHPDRIKPGTKVVIPDFETYRTSNDPEQNRLDARRKGAEIYSRFK